MSNRPAQIWNCDESGFDLQGKAGKVLGPSAPKAQPYRVVTGTKEHITVLPCFNAGRRTTSNLANRKGQAWLWPDCDRVPRFCENIFGQGQQENSFQGQQARTEIVPQFYKEKPTSPIKECPPSG